MKIFATIVLFSILSLVQAWVTFDIKKQRLGLALDDQKTSFLGVQDDNKKNPYQEQIDFMLEDTYEEVLDHPDLTDDLQRVKIIAKAADDRKADDIVSLQVAQCTTMTSYLVIVSGNSRPQNQAIAAAIKEDMEEKVGIVRNPEGTADSGWMILDYGSIMVHIMTPRSRSYYELEDRWRSRGGTGVDLGDVLVPNKVDESSDSTMEGLTEEEDPFWS